MNEILDSKFVNITKLKQNRTGIINKKAQLTPGLRATAPSFQDGGSSKMAISRHL